MRVINSVLIGEKVLMIMFVENLKVSFVHIIGRVQE